MGLADLNVGATVVLKRRAEEVALHRFIRLVKHERVPCDLTGTVVGVAWDQGDLRRRSQFTAVLLVQRLGRIDVHQEPTHRREVLAALHDGHVHTVDGDVCQHLVQRHLNVVHGAVEWSQT